MKTTKQPWTLISTVAATVLLAAGCAVDQGADGQYASGSLSQAGQRSPAGDRVIAGIAELVLTAQAWPTFEEARANRIDTVVDGSPLYAQIRATRPLGELAHPADPAGSYTFSDYPHLFLHVGDNDSLRILNTCYITLSAEDSRAREIVVPLAPLTYRPGQVPADCWLATVTSGRAGKRTYEIRLAGFAGKFESWLPVPDLLAVAPVPADLATGAGEYAAMLKATPMRNATRVASAAGGVAIVSPVAPGSAVATPIRGSTLVATSIAPMPGPRQAIGSSRMELQLQTLSAALLGRRPSEVYFMDSEWASTSDQRGRVVQQHAFAAAVFKGASCSWLRLKAFRRPGAPNLTDVEQAGDPIEVNCTDL